MKKDLKYFINQYLQNRPLFYSLIRPQEALLFYKNLKLMNSPILDFGCGDGFFAQTIFGTEKIDIGLDLTISRAQEAVKKNVYKKVVLYTHLQPVCNFLDLTFF